VGGCGEKGGGGQGTKTFLNWHLVSLGGLAIMAADFIILLRLRSQNF